MDKEKIFNSRTDKLMKRFAIASGLIGLFSLIILAVLYYLSSNYSA
ncbi:MAG: hypothetical protein WC752_03275 [Patescibacteria group bacterium]|jgi:hypothetical protein